ncbi:MAG: trigger factor [Anaerolineales bacterium]
MKLEKQILESHRAEITLEVDADVVAANRDRALRKLSKKVKIPGFRPGKAPLNVVERHVDETAVLEQTIDFTIDELYPKVIEESKIEPYGPGSVKELVSIEPLVIKFDVPLAAEVNLGNYREIRVPYTEIGDLNEAYEEELNALRQRNAIIESVERPAEIGDQVTVLLSGAKITEEPPTDEDVLIHERSIPFVIETPLETPEATEWPFPGFSAQLIGKSAGDELTLEHTFSEDTPYESLRGIPARFKVKVEQVHARTLPELNEDFAATVGDFATFEELEQALRTFIRNRHETEYHKTYDAEVLDAVLAQASIAYPEEMLKQEIDELLHDLQHRIEDDGLDLETYLKMRGQTEEDLRAELQPIAEKRLRRSLTLFEIAKKENIEVSPLELEREVIRMLQQMSKSMDEKEFKRITNNKDAASGLVGSIMVDMLTARSLAKIRQIARGLPDDEATEATEAAEAAETQAEEQPAAEPEIIDVEETESAQENQ